MIATGSMVSSLRSSTRKYQITPLIKMESVTRSAVESKNAPRMDVGPPALATGPSSRSGTAATISITKPANSRPLPTSPADTAAAATPAIVSELAVRPT